MKANKCRPFWAVLSLVVFVSFLAAFYCIRTVKEQRPIGITVFIHGTVGVSLALLGDEFISSFRNHPLVEQDQILGREGLHEFSLLVADAKHASSQLIPIYDTLLHRVDAEHSIKKYLIFGWSGLLSQEARKKAGFDLYDKLCDYRDRIKAQCGCEPNIRIVGHSHGGNVPLWLVDAEQAKGRNLKIDLLYMMGAPMQVETAPFILSKMFKKMILGYSHGDGIQGNDCFSTSTGKSYKHMASLVDLDAFVAENPGYIRCDMRYVVNRESKRVTHPNMWFMGRSKKLADFIDPLALVVFVPLFARACEFDSTCTHYTAHLDAKAGICCTYLTAGKKDSEQAPKIGQSENLYEFITQAQQRVNSDWQADDKIRSILFNRKNLQAIGDALAKRFNK